MGRFAVVLLLLVAVVCVVEMAYSGASCSKLVPCPCPFCAPFGRQVTSYIRRQHSKRYYETTLHQPSDCTAELAQEADVHVAVTHNQVANSARINEDTDIPCCSDESAANQEQQEFEECFEQGDADELEHFDEESSQTEHTSTSTCADTCTETVVSNTVTGSSYDLSVYDSGPATTPLYQGAQITVLQAIVQYFYWFTEHPSISKNALSDLLHFQHHFLLPHGNLLPDSYEKAMKLVQPFLITPLVFHCCPNDCIIFRGENLHLTECPVCHAKHYAVGSSSVAVKRFIYLPIGPRLVRIFGTTNLAFIVQNHVPSSSDPSDVIYDIHHSPMWKKAYDKDGIFQGDQRGIALAFCTDGVNPFSHNRASYSMWPVVLTLLNLPRKIRQSFANLMLVGIIPAGKGGKEAATLNPYLEIIVDELLGLSNQCLYDAYSQAPFDLKVKILLYVLDYPGMGKVFSTVGSGAYQGCVYCEEEGTRDPHLEKMVYLQNRRFLPANSPLRKDNKHFPDKACEERPPPTKRVYSALKPYHHAYDHAKNKTRADAIARATGCKGTYALMKLPEHDRLLQSVPDAMHTIKDAVEHVIYLIIGREDSEKVRKAEFALDRFNVDTLEEPATKKRKTTNPQQKRRQNQQQPLLTAPFRLTTLEVKTADERMSSVILPSHDFTPTAVFSKPSGLKSHDWKEMVSKGILKFCLRGMLAERQRTTLFTFLDALSLSESHRLHDLPELENRLNTAIALLERDFPISIQVVTMHLLHIIDGIQRFGPVYSTWMFPYERFNSWMCRRALNRANPEATVMQTYRIHEWCQYMEASGRVSSLKSSNDVRVLPAEVTVNTEQSKQSSVLSDQHLQLLDEAYRAMIPEYKCLSDQYTIALRKARNARKLSTLPARSEWKMFQFPPGSTERQMLMGPKSNITLINKVVIEDQHTHRQTTLTAMERDSVRHCSSYVQFTTSPMPTFGHIKCLFRHEFAGQVSQMAILCRYVDVHKDQDSGLWGTIRTVANDTTAIAPVNHLSPPLVVAIEGDHLWFLTSQV